MKISEAYPSNYLKAADLQGRTIRVTITIIQSEEIVPGEHKPVMYFSGKDKGLVLNKTNASTIAMAFGDDTDAWQGADIELFSMAVSYQGQMVPALRVRVPPEPVKQPAQVQAAPNPRAPTQAQTKAYDERNPPPAAENDVPF